jgi:hypothetical protein
MASVTNAYIDVTTTIAVARETCSTFDSFRLKLLAMQQATAAGTSASDAEDFQRFRSFSVTEIKSPL